MLPSRPPLFQGTRSLIPIAFYSFGRPPSGRGQAAAEGGLVMWKRALRSGNRLGVDLPDVRSGRTLDRNPTRFHGFRELAHKFDLQQAVVEGGTLDLDVVREIELPLEGPRRNAVVEQLALL